MSKVKNNRGVLVQVSYESRGQRFTSPIELPNDLVDHIHTRMGEAEARGFIEGRKALARELVAALGIAKELGL